MEPENNNMNMPSPAKKSKMGVWIALAVIIIIGLVIALGKSKSEPVTPVDTVVETPTDVGVNQEEPASPAATLSYTAAMKKYANARMQINASCVIPTPYVNLTFKVGSSVMLDNRSNESHSVLFNGTRYTLGAYGFKIVTLNTVKKFMVDCDKLQNVATVTVQK